MPLLGSRFRATFAAAGRYAKRFFGIVRREIIASACSELNDIVAGMNAVL